MLLVTLFDSANVSDDSLESALQMLWEHPQVLAELCELLDVLRERINHVQTPLACRPDAPLQVHARYTRREIQAALGKGLGLRLPLWQAGVLWMPAERVDVFVFTLDKSGGRFSPTTRYRDYAISPEVIHWESQSTTREESDTGQRYQNHNQQGSEVLLFARVSPDDRAFWCLGSARYQAHEGERPMAIQWKLDIPLSGDLFALFAAAVA